MTLAAIFGTLYTDVHGGSSCRVGSPALAGESTRRLSSRGCHPKRCRGMAVLYPDERHFRSHVLARHGFGKVSTLLQIPVARSARRSSHDALSASCRRKRMERADGRRRALSRQSRIVPRTHAAGQTRLRRCCGMSAISTAFTRISMVIWHSRFRWRPFSRNPASTSLVAVRPDRAAAQPPR